MGGNGYGREMVMGGKGPKVKTSWGGNGKNSMGGKWLWGGNDQTPFVLVGLPLVQVHVKQ